MSYCVNCGVKLKKSEKVCPLCNTRVINPNILNNEYKPVYSTIVEEYHKINTKYLCMLITEILFVVALITVLCDFIITKNFTWSIYVVASIIYLDSKLSFILYKKKFIPLIIELLSTEGLLFVIAYLNNGLHWFLYLVCQTVILQLIIILLLMV